MKNLLKNTLKERIAKLWAVDSPRDKIPLGVREKRERYGGNLHNRLREFLYEIGKIDGFISEKEYPLDGERIDVAWRRVERGVPSRVFEIQIGGDIYHALGKLKHAFDLWNSDLFIVITEKHKSKVENLLSGTFHEIKNKVRIINAEAIEELYELQIKDKNLKTSIGLL